MLVKMTLLEAGAPMLIGAPPPTVQLYAKVDGILSLMPDKEHKDRCEITVVGIPKVLTCMESMDSLAKRINEAYLQLRSTSSFQTLEGPTVDHSAN